MAAVGKAAARQLREGAPPQEGASGGAPASLAQELGKLSAEMMARASRQEFSA
eukprot:COSAG01_NODE_32478_length_580_cov_1.488565_1_plen_52_part_01